MANPDAANVLVASPPAGVTGGIMTADIGTALPEDFSDPLTAFDQTGYIGEDGVSLTIDRSTEDIFAWGGNKVRVITTQHSVQLGLSFMEVKPGNLALVFGEDNVTTVGELTTVRLNGVELPHFALVMNAADGDKGVLITAADAQVVSQEDIVFVHSAPTMLTVTIECFADENGDKAKLVYSTDTTPAP